MQKSLRSRKEDQKSNLKLKDVKEKKIDLKVSVEEHKLDLKVSIKFDNTRT